MYVKSPDGWCSQGCPVGKVLASPKEESESHDSRVSLVPTHVNKDIPNGDDDWNNINPVVVLDDER